jgi:dienelactone hydrolase
MRQGVDWAVQNAGRGKWANINASKIAAAGMSCGGVQAYSLNRDSRISAYGIFNSGTLDASQTDATMDPINKPIFFFLGGPSDIAYNNVSPSSSGLRSMTWTKGDLY